MTKDIIRVTSYEDLLTEFDGESINYTIDYLTDLSKKYDNITFDVDHRWDSTYLHYCFDRLETDKEYELRLRQEEIEREEIANKDKQDYEKYLELKQRFESND